MNTVVLMFVSMLSFFSPTTEVVEPIKPTFAGGGSGGGTGCDRPDAEHGCDVD